MINSKSLFSTSALLANGLNQNGQSTEPPVVPAPRPEGTANANKTIQTNSTNLKGSTENNQAAVTTADRVPSKKANALSAEAPSKANAQTATVAQDSKYSEDKAIPETGVPTVGLEPMKTTDDTGVKSPKVEITQPAAVPNPDKQEATKAFSKQSGEAQPPQPSGEEAPLRQPKTPETQTAPPVPEAPSPVPQRPRVRQRFHQPPEVQSPSTVNRPRPNMPTVGQPNFMKPKMPKMPKRPRGL